MNVKTLSELAKEKGIDSGTLRNSHLQGRLPAWKSAGTLLVDLDDPKVQEYFQTFVHRTPKTEKKACLVCGKPVSRERSKYCGRECMGKAMKPEKI